MKDEIVKALRIQEESRNCKALFAVESGSRAWGFASPDSDYDIRVVYAKPVDWYLGLDEHLADTWNVMLPGELDFAAWDVRKAMRQFMKSNAAFMEWLGSPFVYHDTGFLEEIRPFIDRVFNPTHVAFHYASLFLISGDADQSAPLSIIRHKLKKVTVVFNPHEGECHELRRFSTFCKNIPRELPSQCRLPDEVHVGKRIVTCPLSWRVSC